GRLGVRVVAEAREPGGSRREAELSIVAEEDQLAGDAGLRLSTADERPEGGVGVRAGEGERPGDGRQGGVGKQLNGARKLYAEGGGVMRHGTSVRNKCSTCLGICSI